MLAAGGPGWFGRLLRAGMLGCADVGSVFQRFVWLAFFMASVPEWFRDGSTRTFLTTPEKRLVNFSTCVERCPFWVRSGYYTPERPGFFTNWTQRTTSDAWVPHASSPSEFCVSTFHSSFKNTTPTTLPLLPTPTKGLSNHRGPRLFPPVTVASRSRVIHR